MKSYRKELWFNTSQRKAFINITPHVTECLSESGIKEGLALVNAMHITASVFINDDEKGLHKDFDEWLEQLAPYARSRWQHNETGEDNADAHLKRQIMGREVVVAVTNGRLDFGPWELYSTASSMDAAASAFSSRSSGSSPIRKALAMRCAVALANLGREEESH